MEKVLFSLKTLCFKVMVFPQILKIFKLVCLLLCFCQLDCLAEHGGFKIGLFSIKALHLKGVMLFHFLIRHLLIIHT